jgi:hypothetical protein
MTLTDNALISLTATGGVSATSKAFPVVAPLTLTYPNGGETVTSGQAIQITWTHRLNSAPRLSADISYDGGTTWLPTQVSSTGVVATSNTGVLTWTVSGPPGPRARIRVKGTSVTADGSAGIDLIDQSDADFTIAASTTTTTGTINILRPDRGDTWVAGTTASVQWTQQSLSSSPAVNFSADGGMTWTRLRPNGGSNGTYQVTAPMTLTDNALISLTATGGVSATSRAFPVVAPLTLTYPNGGETVTSGQAIQITWTHRLDSAPRLSADISYDGGTTWLPTQVSSTGVVATSNTGVLTWTVSGPPGPRARIRVKGTSVTADGSTGIDVIDQSDADFTIVAR